MQSSVLYGPGWITDFVLNGKIVFKKIEFTESCEIIQGKGLFCDGKLLRKIDKRDKWGYTASYAKQSVNIF